MSANLFADLQAEIRAALLALHPELDPGIVARVELTPTRDPAHGDVATNAAMIAAKPVGAPPRALAEQLAAQLARSPNFTRAEPAGPGFINLGLAPAALRSVLPAILGAGEAYGASALGKGRKVNIEYVSANPTGPLHVGHCRGAVVGDVLANLLAKAGYETCKEFYINDAGAQVNALAWAAYWRYLEALGTALGAEDFAKSAPGGLQYGGAYLIPVGQALAAAHGAALAGPGLGIAPAAAWLDEVRAFAVSAMLALVREDLDALGVRHDVFRSERALLESGAVEAAIETLKSRGLIYEGVLEPPKGKTPEDWEPREQTLFRATRFGDDVDRPMRKSDGSNTYFANDVAYHADKVARGYTGMIDVWGADHGGYVKRMQAAVKALGDGATFEAVLCQIVRVMRNGEPVRMSKRAGTFVELRDLIEEVGAGAVRFLMLMRKSDAQMDFDLAHAVAQTKDNPVFYVQYAHARCRSVLRAAGGAGHDLAALGAAPLDALAAPEEAGLIRRLALWPRTVEQAAEAREPHRIAFYLYDLAGDFHALWNRGRDEATLRFLQETDPAGTRARLALVSATAIILRSGLGVLGVPPVEEMR